MGPVKVRHPITINGIQPQDFGRLVASLRYDALAQFLQSLAKALRDDAAADEKRARLKLAAHLDVASERLSGVVTAIGAAWRISREKMR